MTSNTKSLRLLQYDFQLNISGRSRFVDPVPLASTYAGKRAAVRSGRACLEKLEDKPPGSIRGTYLQPLEEPPMPVSAEDEGWGITWVDVNARAGALPALNERRAGAGPNIFVAESWRVRQRDLEMHKLIGRHSMPSPGEMGRSYYHKLLKRRHRALAPLRASPSARAGKEADEPAATPSPPANDVPVPVPASTHEAGASSHYIPAASNPARPVDADVEARPPPVQPDIQRPTPPNRDKPDTVGPRASTTKMEPTRPLVQVTLGVSSSGSGLQVSLSVQEDGAAFAAHERAQAPSPSTEVVSAVVQELSVDASAQAAESARASGESALETLPAPEPAAAEHPHPQHPLVDGTTVEASSEGAGLRVEASSSEVQEVGTSLEVSTADADGSETRATGVHVSERDPISTENGKDAVPDAQHANIPLGEGAGGMSGDVADMDVDSEPEKATDASSAIGATKETPSGGALEAGEADRLEGVSEQTDTVVSSSVLDSGAV